MNKGIERLKILVKGQEDKALLKIVDYLITLEEMDNYYLNNDKTLKNMVDYIKENAKKQSKNGYCYIEDETVYKWAIDYFIKTDEELGIKKRNIPIINNNNLKKEDIKPEIVKSGQLSLF